MSVQLREVGVAADLTVQVPRDAAGDLAAGVRTMLARVEAVRGVDELAVTGLTPRLNDLQAEVEARLTLALERPDAEAAEARLADGFGVTVASVVIDDSG